MVTLTSCKSLPVETIYNVMKSVGAGGKRE